MPASGDVEQMLSKVCYAFGHGIRKIMRHGGIFCEIEELLLC
jgi:hypothetical protein